MKKRPSERVYRRASAWFLAAGTPVRLNLLLLLLDEEIALPRLAALMKADTGMVSRQLGVLRDAGLVSMIRHGRQVGYRATRTGEVDRFISILVEFMNRSSRDSVCNSIA